MKKHLPLFLLLFAFAGFVSAQGPASTANWFGYILPSSPAEYKYISFTMQDLGSVSVASDEHPAVSTATFAEDICRSGFDAASGDAFEYDFSDQSAGVYIIKVETAKGSDVKQVMLVK